MAIWIINQCQSNAKYQCSDHIFFPQDAIGCLASISDSLITKNIFMSSLERFQLINGVGEFEKLGSHTHALSDKEPANSSTKENAQR